MPTSITKSERGRWTGQKSSAASNDPDVQQGWRHKHCHGFQPGHSAFSAALLLCSPHITRSYQEQSISRVFVTVTASNRPLRRNKHREGLGHLGVIVGV